MNDVGTRLEHLSDLQELWSTGLDILTRGTYHSEREKAQAEELEIALKLLENHMTKDFNMQPYAREVNELPKNAEDIKDENPSKE
jgi:hypothetical protein